MWENNILRHLLDAIRTYIKIFLRSSFAITSFPFYYLVIFYAGVFMRQRLLVGYVPSEWDGI